MGFAAIFFAFTALFLWAGHSLAAASFTGAILVAVVFYQAALAEAVTGTLYCCASLFRVNPGFLFKKPRGRVRWLIRFFCWPYLFFEWQSWRRYRHRGREPQFEEVRDGLFLGARITSGDVDQLRRSGISAVLDAMAEWSAPAELASDPAFLYATIPALDGTAPTLSELTQGALFLETAITTGRKVLVHCTFGHGRSAVMAAAALISMGHARTREEAIGILKKLHRKIWLSREQARVLDLFVTGRGAKGVENP